MPSISRCPGQDARSLSAEDLPCPKCLYKIEFFSDEKSRTCPQCGYRLTRDLFGNCAEWCSAAATCAILRGAAPPESD